MSSAINNVTALPVAESERYVNRKQLADLMGVHVSTIDKWLTESPPIPSETWGMRARRFRPSLAIAWARERQYRRAA